MLTQTIVFEVIFCSIDHAADGSTNCVCRSYMGGGSSFTTRGIDHSPWLGQLGVGVALRTSETTMIGIDYDLERRDGFHAQTASAKFQLMF